MEGFLPTLFGYRQTTEYVRNKTAKETDFERNRDAVVHPGTPKFKQKWHRNHSSVRPKQHWQTKRPDFQETGYNRQESAWFPVKISRRELKFPHLFFVLLLIISNLTNLQFPHFYLLISQKSSTFAVEKVSILLTHINYDYEKVLILCLNGSCFRCM